MKNLLFSLVVFSSIAFGQKIDFNRYQGLECQGRLSKVFTSSLDEKVAEHRKEILQSGDNLSEKRQKKKFALYASYSLSELVLNGQVLFGDELTKYVTKVGEKIIDVSRNKKKDQIEFFVVKSPYVNAFTTNEGKIFVTVGLISQLETEAQLAYILAHEIAHFDHGHVLEGFLFNKKADKKSASRYSGGSALLKKSLHSQEKELEADREGLKLFLKTAYGTSSLYGVFDVLQFSHLPIDEIKFDPTYLENENFKISKSHFPDSLNPIELIEDRELSTHPSSEKRAEKIEELLKEENKKGKHFLYGLKEFKYKRNIARFELSKILLQKRKYQALLYNNYVLSKEFKNNYFIDYSNARALYFLSKYKLRNETQDVIFYSDDIQGESQAVYSMVENMPNKTFSIMSIAYIWKMAKKYPDDKKFKELAKEILNEVIYIEDLKESDFIKMSKVDYEAKMKQDKIIDEKKVEKDDEFEYKRSSKYKRINKNLEENEKGKLVDGELKVNEDQASKYTLGSYFKDPEFAELFFDAFDYKQWKTRKDDKMEEIKSDRKTYKKWKKEHGYFDNVWNNANEKSLGVESIMFVDPMHLVFDTRKKEVFRMETTTDKQSELRDIIKDCGSSLGMGTIMLDSKDLNSGESERFNDIIALNQLIKELNVHNELDSIVVSDFKGLSELSKKYGTSKVAWNVMLSYKEPDDMSVAATIFVGIYLLPALPFAIYDAVTPDQTMINFFYVYDIEKGEVIYANKSKIEGPAKKYIIKQNIYNHMRQINRKPKK